MALIIGMDEAGYGPNLGPLVVTAVAWEVPGNPTKVDLWREFAGVVGPEPAEAASHVQIADSKEVYTPARGLAALEAGVLASLAVRNRAAPKDTRRGTDVVGRPIVPGTFRELCADVAVRPLEGPHGEPWFDGGDVSLPHASSKAVLQDHGMAANDDNCIASVPDVRLVDAWRERCAARGIRLAAVCADVVLTRRFNAETRRLGSKGQALSEISMHVLAHLREKAGADPAEPMLILADKHGGRNRYHEFLPIVFGDEFIRCMDESLERSRYRVGRAEVRFETRSERYFPVALASMVSKYLRELAMVLFNRFWKSHLADLRPTAGYPLDSRRFRADISEVQQRLGIADDALWRER